MRITVYTVPHTGTHFATKFLDTLGIERSRQYKPFPLSSKTHWWRCHAAQGPSGDCAEHDVADSAIIPAAKLVVTARDPYLSAIRYFGPGRRPMAKLKYRWDTFLSVLEERKKPYFILDIGCREKDRYQHLLDLAEYTGVSYDEDVVRKYADSWKPENATDTSAKAAYLANGVLPELECDGTWSMLDDAVAWYKTLPTNDYEDK